MKQQEITVGKFYATYESVDNRYELRYGDIEWIGNITATELKLDGFMIYGTVHIPIEELPDLIQIVNECKEQLQK